MRGKSSRILKSQNELSNTKAYLEAVCYLMHFMNYVRAQQRSFQVDMKPQLRMQGAGAYLAAALLPLFKNIAQEQHPTTEANAENEC